MLFIRCLQCFRLRNSHFIRWSLHKVIFLIKWKERGEGRGHFFSIKQFKIAFPTDKILTIQFLNSKCITSLMHYKEKDHILLGMTIAEDSKNNLFFATKGSSQASQLFPRLCKCCLSLHRFCWFLLQILGFAVYCISITLIPSSNILHCVPQTLHNFPSPERPPSQRPTSTQPPSCHHPSSLP